jgi:UDP-3-O-[3-hydroxymyristoyl] glucosamine N-acyltransferase
LAEWNKQVVFKLEFMEFTLSQLAGLLNGELVGEGHTKVNKLSKIEEAGPGSVSFLSNKKYEKFVYSTKASAIIVNKDFRFARPVNVNLIKVEDSYSAFTRLLEEYKKLSQKPKTGIEQPSYIDETAEIGTGLYLGAFAYIGHGAKISNHVQIYSQVYIGENVSIGDQTIIYPGVRIYDDTVIGAHCVIHAGAVIGSDGFGFAPQKDGTYKTIPQLGNVIIEDHVDIGANTTIDCATIGSTRIRKGVKVDNLVQIGHNCEIGENTVIAGLSGLAGSAKIGKSCVIGGQVGIAGHLEVADRVTLAAKTGVSKSINETGTVKWGYHAMDHRDFMKSYAVFKNLPDLTKRIKELEEKMLNLGWNRE